MGKIFTALQKAKRKEPVAKSKDENKVAKSKRILEHQDYREDADKITLAPKISKQDPQKNNIDFSDQPYLLLNIQERLEVLEQFRLLRSNIFAAQNGKARPKCIMITSPVPMEGKSTIACNLAISIALGVNDQVLLIDADMRKPCQHELLKVDFTFGLADYLLREDVEFKQATYSTAIERLTLIPSGAVDAHMSTELLASKKMRALVTEAKSMYTDRYVILDTPPCSLTSDPSVLVDCTDAIVLVVRNGYSTKDQIDDAIKLLGRDKICGIVFNCLENSFGLGKYSKYKRYYRRYYK